MGRFGRRQRSVEEDPPDILFADADSVSGIHNGGTSHTGNTFSARIIVSDGTSNTCVTEIKNANTASNLDTTLGLDHDLSVTSSGEGNELVIITNADGFEETSSDEESPIEVSNKMIAPNSKDKKVDRKMMLLLLICIILFVTFVVLAVLGILALTDGNDSEAQRLDADASFQEINTIEPGTFDPSVVPATIGPSEGNIVTDNPTMSPTIMTSSPTEKETLIPTNFPAMMPATKAPITNSPTSPSPTTGSTVAPTSSPTPATTYNTSEGPTAQPSVFPTTEEPPFPVPAVASFSVVPTPVPATSSTQDGQTQ